MTEKKWLDQSGKFTYNNIPAIHEKLPTGVYELGFDAFKSEFVLDQLFEKFELPPKIYDLEEDLISRVINTFTQHNKNFGILLKGLKGTGKTIAAKVIANKLKLPVILVTKPFTDMGNYVNSIQQDIILLFDEFEKTYNLSSYNNDESAINNISNLLTLMDGVFTSEYKRLFLLTTNKEYLPDAMIARPSRIRYIKDFSHMSLETVMFLLNDVVKNKELIPGLLEIIKKLEVISIDIVNAIAEEANLYDTAEPAFYEIFNVKKKDILYKLHKMVGDKKVPLSNDLDISEMVVGRWLNDETGDYLGKVVSIDRENQKIVLNNLPQLDHNENEEYSDATTLDTFYIQTKKYHQMFSSNSHMIL